MTTNNKHTAQEVTENIFHKLHAFFGGQFHFGIHGITYSKKAKKMVEWCHPLGWFTNEIDLCRNAKLSDVSLCLKKNREGLDVYVRPAFDIEDYFILFDDLNAEKAVRWSKRPGTMIVNTSPGKFQAWRHLDRPMTYEEKMAYIKMENADAEATPTHRWYRCPGFRNYKAKYAPNFPMARLTSITEGLASLTKLDTIKQAPAHKEYAKIKTTHINVTRNRYIKGNESQTDFSYTMALIRFGATDEEIMSRIMTERTNWENKPAHQELREKYVKRTIENARRMQSM